MSGNRTQMGRRTQTFFLICENILKSIAATRSECTAQQENKASYKTDCIVSDLIDIFGDD